MPPYMQHKIDPSVHPSPTKDSRNTYVKHVHHRTSKFLSWMYLSARWFTRSLTQQVLGCFLLFFFLIQVIIQYALIGTTSIHWNALHILSNIYLPFVHSLISAQVFYNSKLYRVLLLENTNLTSDSQNNLVGANKW